MNLASFKAFLIAFCHIFFVRVSSMTCWIWIWAMRTLPCATFPSFEWWRFVLIRAQGKKVYRKLWMSASVKTWSVFVTVKTVERSCADPSSTQFCRIEFNDFAYIRPRNNYVEVVFLRFSFPQFACLSVCIRRVHMFIQHSFIKHLNECEYADCWVLCAITKHAVHRYMSFCRWTVDTYLIDAICVCARLA